MSSVAAAANKETGHRRLSDQVRLQTGHMLTFDDLAHRDGITEKNVMYKVLERRIHTNTLLLNLPLSLMYFFFYSAGYYLHEDISNVFFLESTIRMRTDRMFLNVQTVDELWDQLEGPFLDVFFVQEDARGRPLSKSSGTTGADGVQVDRWGQWGRVETFNQLQGAMQFTQSRRSLDAYGRTPYNCNSTVACNLCRNNTGFQIRSAPTGTVHQCGSWSGRLLEEVSAPPQGEDGSRRLDLYREEMAGTINDPTKDKGERFEFFLFTGAPKAELRERLRYFRTRGWLDHFTDYMEIKFFLLNCELGRCRLEQVELVFRFSQGGGIYYARTLYPVFLEWFSGSTSMAADAAFIVVWFVSSVFRFMLAWRAFLRAELVSHLTQPLVMFEFLVVIMGFGVIGVIFFFKVIAESVKDALSPVRELGWALGDGDISLVQDMFTKIETQMTYLDYIRFVGNFFALVLMFRFFVNFGAQPRLRVVTTTLAVVLNDLFHFVLVFIPVIFAYCFSGIIMFGRSFDAFTTLKASVGSAFRIMMESEYDWASWTEEYYWTTGIWAWTFMFMVVLLMLNMVLAIILDVYNEVRNRSGAKDAEPMWTTLYHVIMRAIYIRTWVGDRKLLKTLAKGGRFDHSIITEEDILDIFPRMPKCQADFLFHDCKKEMKVQADRDLDNRSLLQASGTLMHNLDGCNTIMKRLNVDEAKDPIHVWTSPHVSRTSANVMGFGSHETFMTVVSHSKGTKNPHIIDPFEEKPVHASEDNAEPGTMAPAYVPPPPEWLKDVNEMLEGQRKWLMHAQWQLQKMQWQMQLGHISKYQNGAGEKPVL